MPVSLADTYLQVQPHQLGHYYLDTARNERLFLAESIFPRLVSSLDLSNPVKAAVAATATDDSTFKQLMDAGQSGDPHAQGIIQKLRSIYHGIQEQSEPTPQDDGSAVQKVDIPPEEISHIEPRQLQDWLLAAEVPHDREKRLLAWLKLWLSGSRSQEAYTAAKAWLDYFAPERIDAEVYEELLPAAQEHDGTEQVFEYLCRMFVRCYGWSWFTSGKKQLDSIKHRLRQEFPDQWREFIRRTRASEQYGFPSPRYSYLPVQTGTELLVYFGACGQAEALVDASIRTAEELMADLDLPKVGWADQADSANEVDILRARLLWPSLIVRERAAKEISDLLIHPDYAQEMVKSVRGWLEDAQLETHVAIILLPVARAVRKNPRPVPTNLNELRGSLKRPSIVAAYVMEEIARAFERAGKQ